MDMVSDIDDDDCMRMVRLFNEPAGRKYLLKQKIDKSVVNRLDLLGISSMANILGTIKLAKYYEMTENDILFTVATDSMEMYMSRLKELQKKFGEYTEIQAGIDFEKALLGQSIDYTLELSYYDKKRMHNLKYFTWIEQQGKTIEELNAQWYDDNYWTDKFHSYQQWDKVIKDFNDKTGLLKKYK